VDQKLRYQLDLDGVDKDALPMVIDDVVVDGFVVEGCRKAALSRSLSVAWRPLILGICYKPL